MGGGFTETQREVTNEKKRRREEGEQQFDSRPVFVSHHLLYRSFWGFFFLSGSAASELLGTPGRRLLQGHTGPKRREVLSAAHVRSLERENKDL